MNNFHPSSPSAVPCIRIHDTEDNDSALFDSSEVFLPDMGLYLPDAIPFACSQGLQQDFFSSDPLLNPPSELEDIPELSHLSTTSQPSLTGFGYSLPYSAIMREGVCTDRGLSPASLGSPAPSPSSFGSSPSSLYDPLAFSDTEPDTPDPQYLWDSCKLNRPSDGSLALHPPFFPGEDFPPPYSSVGPHRTHSPSSPRHGQVASKAMLEANGRRRRHPAQFHCEECGQTFTAQFSLKRHKQSHSGERPFECGIPGCSQRFYNSSDCKRHERSKKRHKDL